MRFHQPGHVQLEVLSIRYLIHISQLDSSASNKLQDRLASCNLLFNYTEQAQSDTFDTYTFLITTGETGNGLQNKILLDQQSVQSILHNIRFVGRLDKAETQTEIEKMAPAPKCVFRNLFESKQFYKFLNPNTSQYLNNPVHALIAVIRPFGILVPEAAAYKLANSQYRFTAPVITFGCLITEEYKRSPMLIPLNIIVNFEEYKDTFPNNHNHGLFFVIGPDSELTCGQDVGGRTYTPNKFSELFPYFHTDNHGDKHTIYEQSLIGMYYIAKEDVTTHGVLEDVVKRCITNFKTTTRVNQPIKISRTVAVIKLGLILPADDQLCTFTVRKGNVIVPFSNIHFSPGQTWSYRDFNYAVKHNVRFDEHVQDLPVQNPYNPRPPDYGYVSAVEDSSQSKSDFEETDSEEEKVVSEMETDENRSSEEHSDVESIHSQSSPSHTTIDSDEKEVVLGEDSDNTDIDNSQSNFHTVEKTDSEEEKVVSEMETSENRSSEEHSDVTQSNLNTAIQDVYSEPIETDVITRELRKARKRIYNHTHPGFLMTTRSIILVLTIQAKERSSILTTHKFTKTPDKIEEDKK